MKNAKKILVACLLSLVFANCAQTGLVLRTTSRDARLGSRDYHFANQIIGLDFYYLKSDDELGVEDRTSVFIENRTDIVMTVTLNIAGRKRAGFIEQIPPHAQAVVSAALPYDEWLILAVQVDKNYITRLKLEQ